MMGMKGKLKKEDGDRGSSRVLRRDVSHAVIRELLFYCFPLEHGIASENQLSQSIDLGLILVCIKRHQPAPASTFKSMKWSTKIKR